MTEFSIEPDRLGELLRPWLPNQRWFAGKQRIIQSVQPTLVGTIGPAGATIQIWIVQVGYEDGLVQHYQVPLSFGTDDQGNLAHARVGDFVAPDDADTGTEQTGTGAGTVVHIHDAMWNKGVTQAWLDGIANARTAGPVQFHLSVDAQDIPLGEQSTVLTGEQSNTSTVFGDQAILKVFRRLESGLNPDIEIHDALGRLGGRHIAKLLGYVTADASASGADDLVSLGMLQEFLSTATDGWELAKISVRDLMAEADLHAAEAGGDFAGEAYRLGIATAEIHADLAEAFGTATLDAADMRARADAMLARLEDAIVVVPELAAVADGLRANYEAFAVSEPMLVQRVHGDLHLGQVMRTLKRWVVLDFEGEPVKSIMSRRDLDATVRDVAGMMRSFDYAANHQVIDAASDNQRAYRAREWSERNRDAFCAGYAHVHGTDPREVGVLLRAFEADKAVYEAVYEARNRPAWLLVPLASLGRLSSPPGPSTLTGNPSAHREDLT